MCKKIKEKINSEIREYQEILHNVPSLVFTIFVVSVILMNLLGNKELYHSDGGRAAIKVNVVAMLLNLSVAISKCRR